MGFREPLKVRAVTAATCFVRPPAPRTCAPAHLPPLQCAAGAASCVHARTHARAARGGAGATRRDATGREATLPDLRALTMLCACTRAHAGVGSGVPARVLASCSLPARPMGRRAREQAVLLGRRLLVLLALPPRGASVRAPFCSGEAPAPFPTCCACEHTRTHVLAEYTATQRNKRLTCACRCVRVRARACVSNGPAAPPVCSCVSIPVSASVSVPQGTIWQSVGYLTAKPTKSS